MAESTVQHRDARDRVVHALGLGLSYPMRDLPLTYDAMVAFDLVTQITIGGSQAGVRYQLCDEDGNPIPEVNGQTFFAEAQPGDADAILPTPPIIEDVTYTILAVREESRALSLETYLNEVVSIKAGVDNRLAVTFDPHDQQVNIDDHQIVIAYNQKVFVTVRESQEGISYQLYEETDQKCQNIQKDVSLSNAWKGTRGDIILFSKVSFTEDVRLLIKAFRTTDEGVCSYLEARLTVNVRPTVAVDVDVDPNPRVYDYEAPATFSLTGAQASASYRLYQRRIVPGEYVSEDTEGRLEISTDGETLVFVEEGHTEIANEAIPVFIATPEKTEKGDIPSDFSLVGAFEEDGEVLSITTDLLLEDTLFVVQATKTFKEQATGETREENLQLDETVVLLVRPDRAPVVGVVASPVEADAIGMVTLAGTQHGVFYQMVDPDDTLVGFPGYHYEERGVQRTRLEVDFVIEAQEPVDADGALLLPTGPLTETKTFTILAAKTLTGISAPLKSTAKIDVVTEDGG